MSEARSEPVVFDCDGASLVGVLHRPAGATRDVGVIFVVGGPQYRVGSHRQFVLTARRLAAAGYPVLRFDYRGMGDSGGEYRGFEGVDRDVEVAVGELLARVRGLRGVVLWGLCDGASAAFMYAHRDPRVLGVVVANPWVRTQQGEAEAYVRTYYSRQLLDRTFWSRLLRGEVRVFRSLRDFVGTLRTARRAAPQRAGFLERMRAGAQAFSGPVLSLESGRDLTMAEFDALTKSDERWREVAARGSFRRVPLAEADHTFSERRALEASIDACLAWLAAFDSSHAVPADGPVRAVGGRR